MVAGYIQRAEKKTRTSHQVFSNLDYHSVTQYQFHCLIYIKSRNRFGIYDAIYA